MRLATVALCAAAEFLALRKVLVADSGRFMAGAVLRDGDDVMARPQPSTSLLERPKLLRAVSDLRCAFDMEACCRRNVFSYYRFFVSLFEIFY